MYYLLAAFTIFWVVLSEKLTAEGVFIGIAVALAVMLFNKASMENLKLNRILNFKIARLAFVYVFVLIKDIFIANIHVAKIVLGRELKIMPMLVKISTPIKSDFRKSIYANSITLTPGTLTVMLDKEVLLVHCLEEKSAEGLKDSGFEKIILESEE